MNVNMLRDADNDAGFWAAVCAADPATRWRGASLYVSTDGGATYTFLVSMPNEATIGVTTDVLADFAGGSCLVDELTSVNVDLRNGEFTSTNTAGLLAGTFCIVIGREILFVRDAVLETDGTYTLTGFLRGRRGSEFAMASHTVGERVVLVDFSAFARVAQATADIGISRKYKAVTAGATLADTPALDFANEGAGLECYAPVHLGGGRDAAGNLAITWDRRNRISGEWRDYVDVPMSESVEAYTVDVYSDDSYTTLKRSISASTPEASYSAADQTTDFGAPQLAGVACKVRQLSAIVGPGYELAGSI